MSDLSDEQFENFSVCQKCGAVAPRGTKDWIDAPHTDGSGIRVVRCPQHWSEWALRFSIGRSRSNMLRWRILEAKAEEEGLTDFNPYIHPFPAEDEPIEGWD